MNQQSIARWVKLSKAHERYPEVFPSFGSVQWYFRGHKAGLVAAGAVKLHAGAWYIDPGPFEAYVGAAAAEKAAKAV